MSRHGVASRVEVRLYMEGVYLPNALVNVSVHAQTSSPAGCVLQLVPTNTIRHILPGTWVHVFVTDPWDSENKGDLSDFKLLFEGVVIGRGLEREDESRSFTVRCSSPEIYWANAKQYWLNVTSANGDIFDQAAVATSGGYGQFGTTTNNGVFGYMVSRMAFSREVQEQAEERFLETIISVIDDIGNVNPFYTNVRNRFRLTDRIITANAGNTVQLFQLALLSDFLDGITGRQSGQTNLVEVINQILSAVMHEWVSVLAPPYVRAQIFDRDVFGNLKRRKQTLRKRGPRNTSKVEIHEQKVATDDIVASCIFKPHVYTIDPPNFNVLYPNMYDLMSYEEDFLAETTRTSMRPNLPLVNRRVTQGVLFQRPTELEVFTALVRDGDRAGKRTADGEYADGAGQAPTFTEYDWATNEERIRGINFNFLNLAPAPSTLTLNDPGKRSPSGSRKGGVPRYLQNVVSYEYYKAKFMARLASVRGPFNMRPVPGFPMVLLDDSDAKLTVVCYLGGIAHNIDANGSATTQYMIQYPRLADEVDYNRPKFTANSNAASNPVINDSIDTSLLRDEKGNFRFETLFDGTNEPPIPEWFDETFRNTRELDLQYQSWFGEEAGVMQGFLFRQEDSTAEDEAEETADDLNVTDEEQRQEIIDENEKIAVTDAITQLAEDYRKSRGLGREYVFASEKTRRGFTQIDQAFRFIGAGPVEFADVSSEGQISFTTNPADERTVNYKTAKLELFAGDVSSGSGYSATTEADTFTLEDETGATEVGKTDEATDRMSGAFPIFETEVHFGDEAIDRATRQAKAKEDSGPSTRARYDGRPTMFDFEARLWLDSLSRAGLTPTSVEIAENSTSGDYTVENGVVRRKTGEERKDAAVNRRQVSLDREERLAQRRAQGRHDPSPPRCPNMPPREQAPTGSTLDQEDRKPLTQPLSEKQVVDLRRQVVEAYKEELERNRGFPG